MGAISAPSSIPFLRKYLSDSDRNVRETCEIALAKIEWDNSEEGKKHQSTTAISPEQYARILHYLCSFNRLCDAGSMPPLTLLRLHQHSCLERQRKTLQTKLLLR